VSGVRRRQPASLAHFSPVIFVGRATKQAYLIVTTAGIDPWPGKPMRASPSEKLP
jgi:hypothetical protein